MFDKFSQVLAESGCLPDWLVRVGIRRLIRRRLHDVAATNKNDLAANLKAMVGAMRQAPVAALPEKANQQHYEVPAEFYRNCLGGNFKYSCAYWPKDVVELDLAEIRALQQTCEHADLQNGMTILELGCGWGSLSLYMAKTLPDSKIIAVSNSLSQAEFIRACALERNLSNVEVITCDMNEFHPQDSFDRIVSVEMFEHMRNWQTLFERVSNWLKPDGMFFIHIFVHRNTPYFFEDEDDSDWMSRHFFSGGLMPSLDLPLSFQEHLRLNRRWIWDGTHYQKTAEAWLQNMDRNRADVDAVLQATYGRKAASIWRMRWRFFYMACAELFGFNDGEEWFVAHYRFTKS